MIEIWKDIEGYEGVYQISSLGRVRSLNYNHTGEIKIIKLQDNGKGYLRAHLHKNNKTKKYMVHRLVAQAFIPNPDNLPFINHKDENSHNNTLNNLEWCTHEYNINYGTRTKKANQSKSKKILQFDSEGNFIKLWDSIKSASENLCTSHSSIVACLKGKYKLSYVSIWKYYDLDTYLIGKMNRNIKEKRMAC